MCEPQDVLLRSQQHTASGGRRHTTLYARVRLELFQMKSPRSRAPGAWELTRNASGNQQAPPERTRKNDSMSASVPTPPSQLKSALGGQVAQQLPDKQAQNASMSAPGPTAPA